MRAGAQGGFMAATDLADYLAAQGVPFREAHEIVGKLVLELEREGRTLQDLTAEELPAASSEFGADARRRRGHRRRGRASHERGRHCDERGDRSSSRWRRDALEADTAWLEAAGE